MPLNFGNCFNRSCGSFASCNKQYPNPFIVPVDGFAPKQNVILGFCGLTIVALHLGAGFRDVGGYI